MIIEFVTFYLCSTRKHTAASCFLTYFQSLIQFKTKFSLSSRVILHVFNFGGPNKCFLNTAGLSDCVSGQQNYFRTAYQHGMVYAWHRKMQHAAETELPF